MRELSKTDAAQFKLTHVCPASAAKHTAVPVPTLKFLFMLKFHYIRCFCHIFGLLSDGFMS